MNELNDLFLENKANLMALSKSVQKKDVKTNTLKNLFSAFRTLTDENLPSSEYEQNNIQAFQGKLSTELEKDLAPEKLTKLELSDPALALLKLIQSGTSAEDKISRVKVYLKGNPTSRELVMELLNILLLVDAELEQRLMLEYLYAAYSIETEQHDANFKKIVLEWQQLLISIAREEMGHLITVQNVRKSLGLNIYFKVDYLSELTHIFPYISKLEPFSKTSLAKYIFAESPNGWINSNDPYAKKVRDIIDSEIITEKNSQNENITSLLSYSSQYGAPISDLFNVILLILEHFTKETDFSIPSVTQQARPEQWNRGYNSDERVLTINGKEIKIPASHVLVETAMTRWECIEAIKAIAEQGEDAKEGTIDNSINTHFNRFLSIFKLWDSLGTGKEFSPSKNMATNPTTGDVDSKLESTKIEDPTALKWARLLNIRYSLLIAFIEHSFNIETNFENRASSLKGLIVNGSFGEMYHLKAISSVLSGLPMITGNKELFAGPPFEMHKTLIKRYTKALNTTSKVSDTDFKKLYVEFIKESNALIKEIPDSQNNHFLQNLQNNDRELLALLSSQTKTSSL